MVRKTVENSARHLTGSGLCLWSCSLDGHYTGSAVGDSLQHSDIVIAYSPPTLPYNIYLSDGSHCETFIIVFRRHLLCNIMARTPPELELRGHIMIMITSSERLCAFLAPVPSL
jgi:hypothetical protein